MQNAIIVLGALIGVIAGAYTAHYFFYDQSDASTIVSVLYGAIPGTIVGGWLAYRLTNIET
ncbi:MAG: hypothetical protein OEN23_12715 [Paracoccaceae bacterium]|nr:hypothetical protein [Paracoccaceae bacterium]